MPSLPKHMHALVLTPAGLELQTDRPLPVLLGGDALIQVHLAGVCSTDIELTRGYKGGFLGILGHEFVGTVVECPSAPEWIGERVAGEINIGCGDCELCGRGLGKHCRQRSSIGIIRRDGAFAEYLALPLINLHAVPPIVTDEQAVFVEPLAAALEILEQVPVTARSRAIVLGDGRLGLLCALVLAKTGCDLTVIGHHPAKLELLRAAGVNQTLLSQPETLADLVGRPADIVVEATGSPAGFAPALALVRPMGTLVLKSTFAEHLEHFDVSRLVVDELTIVGSRCGPFPAALTALQEAEIDVLPLIHARYPLSDGLAAFDYARKRGVLKVLIDPRC